MVNKCADESEKKYVKEYIKENDIYIKLGMPFMLFVYTVLIQFSSAFSLLPQINIRISCFSVFCCKSLEFSTSQYP